MVNELPAISYGLVGWAPSTTGHLFEYEPKVSSNKFGGAVGVHLPPSGLARGIVDGFRVEFEGSWWEGEARAAQAADPGTRATYVSVDGSRQVLFGSGSPSAVFETEYRGFETALRLLGDIALPGRIRLSPSIGIVGGERKQDHAIDISTPFAGGTMENPIEVNESLVTREFGAEAGADIRVGVARWLSVDSGLHGAAVRAHTHLKAEDCLGNGAPIGSACTNGFYATTAKASDTTTNYRIRGSVGANLSLPIGVLSFRGFGGWDSAVAGISNPTSDAGLPASIAYDDKVHYGWSTRLTIPFH